MRRACKAALLFLCVIIVNSCTSAAREFLFDVPPPGEESTGPHADDAGSTAAGGGDRSVAGGPNGARADALPPPAIEEHTSWERAQQELPEHELGGVDWNEALAQQLIRPRTFGDPRASDAAAFRYDFIIEGKKEKFNALFPHSAHTQWLGCENCHPAIYPLKRNPASMKEMRGGASCGTCHGSVAFSLKQCKRCHVNM